MDLKESDILGDAAEDHWYYKSKAGALRQIFGTEAPSIILDVGAGSGIFSKHLLRHTTADEAWCVDPGYSIEFDTTECGKVVHYRRSLEHCNADLVLFMDVLEHVDDDVGLLNEYVSKVPRGAKVIVTVPAFNFLWSRHDDFLEHRRRYVIHQVEEVVRSVGLEIQTAAYYFGAVFPLAAATRLLRRMLPAGSERRSDLRRAGTFVNSFLSRVCQLETRVFTKNRWAGLSIFCAAVKP